MALGAWATCSHVVALLDYDLERGALLLESVSPGWKLSDDPGGWSLDDVAPMRTELWRPRLVGADGGVPELSERVDVVFDLARRRLRRWPAIEFRIGHGVMERSHALSRGLALEGPVGLVHGDLHPGNVLRARTRRLRPLRRRRERPAGRAPRHRRPGKLDYARRWRDEDGLTLTEIVERTGLTRSTLCRHLPARPVQTHTAGGTPPARVSDDILEPTGLVEAPPAVGEGAVWAPADERGNFAVRHLASELPAAVSRCVLSRPAGCRNALHGWAGNWSCWSRLSHAGVASTSAPPRCRSAHRVEGDGLLRSSGSILFVEVVDLDAAFERPRPVGRQIGGPFLWHLLVRYPDQGRRVAVTVFTGGFQIEVDDRGRRCR